MPTPLAKRITTVSDVFQERFALYVKNQRLMRLLEIVAQCDERGWLLDRITAGEIKDEIKNHRMELETQRQLNH